MQLSEEILGHLEKYNRKYPERIAILCHEDFFRTISNKYIGKFIYYVLTKDSEAASRLKSSVHRNEIMQYGVRVISVQNELNRFLRYTPSIDAVILGKYSHDALHLICSFINRIDGNRTISIIRKIDEYAPMIRKLHVENTIRIESKWVCSVCRGGGKLSKPLKEKHSKFREQEIENEKYDNE